MLHRVLKSEGIAVGPILFIVALLAILATAIAAGSSAFTSNSDSESASALAEAIISQCTAYRTALQRMLSTGGCNIQKIDWTPNNGFPSGATWISGDYTGGNGTNITGNGRCAMHSPNGGGMNYQKLPSTALMSATDLSVAYGSTSTYGGTASNVTNMNAYAGYPHFHTTTCWGGTGTCTASLAPWSNYAHPILMYWGLTQSVCDAIDQRLNQSLTSSNVFILASSYSYSAYNNNTVRGYNSYIVPSGFQGMQYTSPREGCGKDYASRVGATYMSFVFACQLFAQ